MVYGSVNPIVSVESVERVEQCQCENNGRQLWHALDQLTCRIGQLEDENKKKDEKIRLLYDRVEYFQKLSQGKDDYIDVLEGEVNDVVNQLQLKDETIEELKTANNELKAELQKMLTDNDLKNSQIEELKIANDELEIANVELNAELQRAQTENENLKQKQWHAQIHKFLRRILHIIQATRPVDPRT